MAYTYLNMKELGWIETDFDIGYKACDIAKKLGHSNQPIYNVVNFHKKGSTILDFFNATHRMNRNVGKEKDIYKATDAIS